MFAHTPETQARSAPARWRRQYAHYGKNPPRPEPDWPDPVTVEWIEEHLNPSWTDIPSCSECGSKTDWCLEVGEEPDYESRTAYLCRGCVREAAIAAGLLEDKS